MDNFDYSAIGQRIKTLRKRKGLNQTQLANLSGKSLRTVQKYENADLYPWLRNQYGAYQKSC